MEVRGYFHAPAALFPRKSSHSSLNRRLEPIWTFLRPLDLFCLPGMEPPLLCRFVHSLVTVTSSIEPLWMRGPIASFILWLSILQKISLRHTHVQARTGGGGIDPTHSQPSIRRRYVANIKLRPLYLQERPGTHSTRVWVGLRLWMAGNISPPQGFNPRTAWPATTRYTDLVIPVTFKHTRTQFYSDTPLLSLLASLGVYYTKKQQKYIST